MNACASSAKEASAGSTNGAPRVIAAVIVVHSRPGNSSTLIVTGGVTAVNSPPVVSVGASALATSNCTDTDLVTVGSATAIMTIDATGPPVPSGSGMSSSSCRTLDL